MKLALNAFAVLALFSGVCVAGDVCVCFIRTKTTVIKPDGTTTTTTTLLKKSHPACAELGGVNGYDDPPLNTKPICFLPCGVKSQWPDTCAEFATDPNSEVAFSSCVPNHKEEPCPEE
ncbi:hypothetical protein HGRIS_013906 [Hohenbuehelia grisea]|uniref:Uncharacterized protein n=1 Tax=Hohenbuehelia grisea TaxID=104357 RepID=A0ABR3IX76_9AGAR